MNVDCLLKIFRLMSLSDLAKVADVCILFREVAMLAFQCDWKNETIRLSNKSKEDKLDATSIIRNFGDQLQKVNIVFDVHGNDKFFNMIIENCGTQLSEVNVSSTCFNIETNKVLSKANICRFNAKFTNVKCLRFNNNTDDITEPECIEQTFSAMDQLHISGYPFKNENIERFVQSNPQIRILSLFHCNKVDEAKSLLETIDQQLPQLEELGLWIHGHTAAPAAQIESRLLKNLRRLTLHNYGYAGNLQSLSISSDKLETMQLEVTHCDDALIDFICQYTQLRQLTITMYQDSEFDCKYLKELGKHLPQLAAIEISGFWKNLDPSDISAYMDASKQMVRFTITDERRKNLMEDMAIIHAKLINAAVWTTIHNKSSPRQVTFNKCK